MTNSYLRLDIFKRKRDGKKITYADYVALPKELVEILSKTVDDGLQKGYYTTNQLEREVALKWKEISHLYGIHKENPYKGGYYTGTTLCCLGDQIIWEKWRKENLKLVTEYGQGWAKSTGACYYDILLKEVDIFPLFTHELPENAYLAVLSKAIRFENNGLYWDNGSGCIHVSNPAETEYDRAFFHQHGVK